MPTSLANLSVTEGAKNKRFIKGRGRGTGNGKTAGKGQKGQGAHSHTKKGGFEGGQLPIYRRLPKFGVRKTHRHIKVEYAIVNLEQLNLFEDGAVVDATALIEKGVVKKELDGVKILGRGTLNKKLTVKAAAFSASAKEAIEKLGGSCEVTE
ncbi:MAG: 50S ribosomal protein L15 [Bacilli bacterium]|nr:50S ribosomal protein L15 [Bacilli bacterium]